MATFQVPTSSTSHPDSSSSPQFRMMNSTESPHKQSANGAQPASSRSSISGNANGNTNPDQALFQCGDCKRSYTRVDHLARHVRSHTQEKPYTCPVCSKGFARPDLVKRHAASHETDTGGDAKRQKKTIATGHPSRVSQACKACAGAKLKCEEEKPCRRCRQKNLPCEAPFAESRSGTDLQPESIPDPTSVGGIFIPQQSLSPTNLRSNEMSPRGGPQTIMNQDQNFIAPQYSAHLPTPHISVPTLSEPPIFTSDDTLSGVLEMEGNYFPDFLRDLMMPSAFELSSTFVNPLFYPSRAETPLNTVDFGIETNLELSDLDMGFLDAFNGKNLPPIDTLEMPFNDSLPRNEENEEGYEFRKGVALGADAFRKSSLWGWTPAHQDHGYAEQGNLSLPVNDADSPEARLNFDRQILSERLSPSSRDQILAMVLGTCQPANISRVVTSFPSAEVLDNLLQHFFDQCATQVDSWIHLPTFRVNAMKPEFTSAIVAAGAVFTPLSTVRKLGFALQEAVRLALPMLYERDNSSTRELSLVQAYALHLGIGIWSGNRRKIEIAESFEQPLLTMLRRAGRFRRSKYPTIVPKREDDGEVLEQKWREWVEMESWKRLAFHIFLHDAQCSMSLNVNPLISYAELTLPLPEPKELWRAPTAYHWKRVYFSRILDHSPSLERIPSVIECIHDWSLLPRHIYHIDPHLSGLAILHAMWGLIWEHRQLLSGTRTQPNNWNALILNSRHQELCQLLHHFRMGASDWGVEPAPEVMLVLETLSMHLHMSFEELQLFAGKEDKEEARRVYVSARQWIESQASRQAVWHAGQIVRAARAFHSNALRDFYAIALYHASLAFWSYGIVSRARDVESPSISRPSLNQPTFWLDEEETGDAQRFVAVQRGVPGFRSANKIVGLGDTGSVTDMARDVLRGNFTDELPPPLVENLSQLMRDLAGAARAVSQ